MRRNSTFFVAVVAVLTFVSTANVCNAGAVADEKGDFAVSTKTEKP